MAEMSRVSRFFANRFNARRSRRVFDWIQENTAVSAGDACLEIGCGNGDLASRVVDGVRTSRYVATDVDPRQLEAARSHLAERYPSGIPQAIELREADMLHLPFPEGSFDAVIAIVSIHHATPNHHDPSRVPDALAEIDRVLRPGGRLVYEEILHREAIRTWLSQHAYTLAVRRGFRHELVVARKRAGS